MNNSAIALAKATLAEATLAKAERARKTEEARRERESAVTRLVGEGLGIAYEIITSRGRVRWSQIRHHLHPLARQGVKEALKAEGVIFQKRGEHLYCFTPSPKELQLAPKG